MTPSIGQHLHAHAQALRALARDLVGEYQADDLLQDAALQALIAPPARPGPIGGWLASVLRHLASKHRRSERRRQRREQAAARPEAGPAADSELQAREVFKRLGEAVLALPQPYQGALLRRYLQEQQPREIASATGASLATVKSQLQRGLALLRERLERDGGSEWRLALGATFGFELATVPLAVAPVAVATGAMLMGSGVKLAISGLAAAVAVAAILLVDREPDLPQATPTAQQAPTPAAADPAPLPVAARPAEPTAGRVQVLLAAPWPVMGRAVCAVETPLPGARVLARAFHGTKAEGEPVVETQLVADADGRFTWPLEPPTAITFLELRGEGERVRSYPETFVVAPGDPPPPQFDLWITRLDAVARGRVLDEQGQPIVNARVGSSWQGGVLTDEEGRFEVAVERRASVTLYASARGFVQLRQEIAIDPERAAGEAELRLRTASRMHGRVTDSDGRPVQGAVVRTFYTIFADAAETDADGRFLLDNLDPSLHSHSLFARKEGYVEAKAEVQAGALDVAQDLVLLRGVAVRGTVFDPRGRPVAAATVFLGFSPSAYNRLDAVTDSDGRFAFDCVPAGEETLNVERRGFAGRRQKVTVPKAPAPAVEVRVDLAAGHFIAGTARSKGGQPVAGVSIAPRLDGEYLDGIRGKTDEQGRFRLDGLPDRGLELEFYGGGVLRKQVPVPAVDREDLAVQLERHGSMAGRVVDGRTGEPIRAFRIRFGQPRLREGEQQGGGYSAQWVRGGKAFHDDQGVFRIDEEVQVGAVFALEASAEGYGPLVHDRVIVQLEPDPQALEFALFPGARIDGVVRERGSGVPVAGARVKAYGSGRPLQPHEPNDDEGRPIAVTDERGAFRLDGVGPGEVWLQVEHADWLPCAHGPIPVETGKPVPSQDVLLHRGVNVTVAVRSADGRPLVDAELQIVGSGNSLTAHSDAIGEARFERVPPGERELVLVQRRGEQQVWAFRRPLRVEHEDCRVEFVTSDGTATLVVILEAQEPLPDGLQLWCMPADHERARQQGFRMRGALVEPGRTVIANLPAMELNVILIDGGWQGSSKVTTRDGETVEVRLQVQKTEPRGR